MSVLNYCINYKMLNPSIKSLVEWSLWKLIMTFSIVILLFYSSQKLIWEFFIFRCIHRNSGNNIISYKFDALNPNMKSSGLIVEWKFAKIIISSVFYFRTVVLLFSEPENRNHFLLDGSIQIHDKKWLHTFWSAEFQNAIMWNLT